MANQSVLAPLQPYARSLLRIVAGFTFSLHGLQKLFGLFGGHQVQLVSKLGLAACLESFGGTLMIIGLFTVPVAFLVSGEMAVAYFTAHFPRGFWPIVNGGEVAVLYCFVWLYLFTAGPGPISVDYLVRKKGR